MAEENKTLAGQKQALTDKLEELSRKTSVKKASDAELQEVIVQLRQQAEVLQDTNANLCKENLELITELEASNARMGEDSFVLPDPTKLKAELMASAKGKSPFKSPAPRFNKSISDSFGAEIFQDEDSFLVGTPKATKTTTALDSTPSSTRKPTPSSATTATMSDTSLPRKRTTLGNIAINSPMPAKKMKKDMPSAIKPCSTSAENSTIPKEGGVTAEDEEQPTNCNTQ